MVSDKNFQMRLQVFPDYGISEEIQARRAPLKTSGPGESPHHPSRRTWIYAIAVHKLIIFSK